MLQDGPAGPAPGADRPVLFMGPEHSPVLAWLRQHENSVVQVDQKIDADFVHSISSGFIVSHGYRYKITPATLQAVAGRAVNLHISYLPWNRGADPNLWSFIEDTPKGVTIHYVDDGIDTGDIVAQRLVHFAGPAETLATTYDRLQSEALALFVDNWRAIKSGACARHPQPAGGSVHKSADKARISALLVNGWNTPVSALAGASNGSGDAKPAPAESSAQSDLVILLAHLMDRDGRLGEESRARADKAAALARQYGCPIACMGWSYRDDTDLCVSEALAAYLESAHGFPRSQLLLDRESRDTVGDAIYSKRKFLHRMPRRRACVVTSAYHVERARRVFEFVYGQDAAITVVGADVNISQEIIAHERNSQDAFSTTFSGVAAGDDEAIFSRLLERHPFYNGAVYPRADRPQAASARAKDRVDRSAANKEQGSGR